MKQENVPTENATLGYFYSYNDQFFLQFKSDKTQCFFFGKKFWIVSDAVLTFSEIVQFCHHVILNITGSKFWHYIFVGAIE